MIETKTQSEILWLANRAKGIGGSDIGALLGIDKYKSPYDIWLDKTGQGVPFTGNQYTRAGKKLEKIVVEYFVEDTGAKIVQGDNEIVMSSLEGYPFALGTCDRIFKLENETGVLECKTTQLQIDPDDLPQSWFCQAQWYMGVFNLPFGEIAWLERGVNFGHVRVDFNEQFFKHCLNVASKFWTDNVLANVAPPAINSADVEKLYSQSDPNKTIEASEEVFDAFGELKLVREIIKKNEQTEAEIIEQMKLVLKDAEQIKYFGNTLVSWKTSKDTNSFDLESFKKAEPAMYEKFLKIKPGARRFLIK